MRKTLTDNGVAALKPRTKRYAYPDPELRGHYVRVQPSGAKAFAAVTRNPWGKQVWTTISDTGLIGIDEARKRARSAIERVRAGLTISPMGMLAGKGLHSDTLSNARGGARSKRDTMRSCS